MPYRFAEHLHLANQVNVEPQYSRCRMTARISIATFFWVLLASAAPHAIDTKASTLTIHVGKSGAFSAFGHEHVIAAPIASGSADTAAKSVELHVDATALRV